MAPLQLSNVSRLFAVRVIPSHQPFQTLVPVQAYAQRRQSSSSSSTSPKSSSSSPSPFKAEPSPPRLPAEEQAEFERLQRAAEAALSSHTSISPSASTSTSASASASAQEQDNVGATDPPGEEKYESSTATLSGGIRKGAPPEFAGDKNPKTGEVGGPKNEPLRWGSRGDWSYNGRVTDF